VPDPLAPRELDQPDPDRLTEHHPAREAVLAAHRAALASGAAGYIDPVTGLWVMTARYLAERGTCCRTLCRHCPYVGA
jgi:hypothetical protein